MSSFIPSSLRTPTADSQPSPPSSASPLLPSAVYTDCASCRLTGTLTFAAVGSYALTVGRASQKTQLGKGAASLFGIGPFLPRPPLERLNSLSSVLHRLPRTRCRTVDRIYSTCFCWRGRRRRLRRKETRCVSLLSPVQTFANYPYDTDTSSPLTVLARCPPLGPVLKGRSKQPFSPSFSCPPPVLAPLTRASSTYRDLASYTAPSTLPLRPRRSFTGPIRLQRAEVPRHGEDDGKTAVSGRLLGMRRRRDPLPKSRSMVVSRRSPWRFEGRAKSPPPTSRKRQSRRRGALVRALRQSGRFEGLGEWAGEGM
jgi:hypothetical protein